MVVAHRIYYSFFAHTACCIWLNVITGTLLHSIVFAYKMYCHFHQICSFWCNFATIMKLRQTMQSLILAFIMWYSFDSDQWSQCFCTLQVVVCIGSRMIDTIFSMLSHAGHKALRVFCSDLGPFIRHSLFTMTSSNENGFRVTGHLCGEFTGPRWIPRTKASDAGLWCFFDLRPDKRLSKQSWGWWFETPSHSLWRHRNV